MRSPRCEAPRRLPAGTVPIPGGADVEIRRRRRATTWVSPVTMPTPRRRAGGGLGDEPGRSSFTGKPSSMTNAAESQWGRAPITARSLTVRCTAGGPIGAPGKRSELTTNESVLKASVSPPGVTISAESVRGGLSKHRRHRGRRRRWSTADALPPTPWAKVTKSSRKHGRFAGRPRSARGRLPRVRSGGLLPSRRPGPVPGAGSPVRPDRDHLCSTCLPRVRVPPAACRPGGCQRRGCGEPPFRRGSARGRPAGGPRRGSRQPSPLLRACGPGQGRLGRSDHLAHTPLVRARDADLLAALGRCGAHQLGRGLFETLPDKSQQPGGGRRRLLSGRCGRLVAHPQHIVGRAPDRVTTRRRSIW